MERHLVPRVAREDLSKNTTSSSLAAAMVLPSSSPREDGFQRAGRKERIADSAYFHGRERSAIGLDLEDFDIYVIDPDR